MSRPSKNGNNVYANPLLTIDGTQGRPANPGLTAVCIALNKLGIRTYDMTECARDNVNGSTKRWLEGVEANYLNGQGRKIKNRRDLDDLLYRYQVYLSPHTCQK